MLKPMNVLDAGLLMMESPETPMHIGGLQILKQPRGAGPDHVARLHQQVLSFPANGAPFNYRLSPHGGPLGMPAWEVLDRVDLDQHVFRHALPWPGDERELSAADLGAPILVISQFTLYANTAKGRRPSWNAAAPGPVAEPLVDAVVEELRSFGATVATGRFGAHMHVSLVNDGPVTLILDTDRR